jgi:hypothetical protein
MINICPLLIRAAFIGQTYHDFQLKFESPSNNCSHSLTNNPLLIQFTRIINQTFNDTSYVLYDLFDRRYDLPHLQVFHCDRVDLCIRSAIDSNQHEHERVCHEFYMVTMLTSTHNHRWPLFVIVMYVLLLLIALVISCIERLWTKLSQTSSRHNLKEKLRDQLSLLRCNDKERSTSNDKRQLLKSINTIAKECRNRSRESIRLTAFVISCEQRHGNANRTFSLDNS